MTNSLVAISTKTFPDKLTTSYWPGVSDRTLVEFCLDRNEDA
jgi:hypothetical protein